MSVSKNVRKRLEQFHMELSGGPTDAEMLRYRKENFAVEVKRLASPEFPGEMGLSVTHNGNQWQTMKLLPHEAKAVIKALKASL